MSMSYLRTRLRSLRSARRLAAGVVVCTAIGMAATGMLGALLEMAMFEQPPFPAAERLVRVWNADDAGERRQPLAYPDFLDLEAALDSLERLEAAGRARLIWQREGRPGRRVEGEAVTQGYFDLLGVTPLLGRRFTPSEWRGEGRVLMLGYDAWIREYAGREDIVGTTLRASTQALEPPSLYTIVGVLPPDFHGTIEDDMPDLEFWLPVAGYLSADARGDRAVRNLLAIGRLAPGESMESLESQAGSLAVQLAPEFRAFADAHDFQVESLGANWRAPYRRAAPLLSVAAMLLLAIAAANVALLVMTRALERRHEFALRRVLGARRWQLMSDVVAEVLVLTLLGGILGAAAAPRLLDAVLAVGEVQVPLYVSPAPSSATLAAAFLVLLGVALAAAFLPLLFGGRMPPAAAVNESGLRTGESRRPAQLRRGLVALQLALSLALLTTSGLLARSYLALAEAPLGFAVDDKVRIGLFVNTADVGEEADLPLFAERISAELEARPGVESAGIVWPTVPTLTAVRGRVEHPALATAGSDDGLLVSNYIAGDGFFDAVGLPLLAGRTFGVLDGEAEERRGIVSRSVAELFGGPGRAVNQVVTLNGTPLRIVGVVGGARFAGPRESAEHRHEVYLSFRQLPRRLMSAIVRVSGDPAEAAPALAATLGELAPNSAVDWVDAMTGFFAWMHRDTAFRLALVAIFAVSALLLTTAGVYALFSQQVLRSRHEIGVRKALGASNARIAGRVLVSALRILAAGLALGVALSLALGTVMRGLLYGIDAVDTVALGGACALLVLVVSLTVTGPAVHAARVLPSSALRYQ
jgi:predicted permease